MIFNLVGGAPPVGSITITENGAHDVTDYATAVVNVSGGGGGVELANVVVCTASGSGYGRVDYTDENMEPQTAAGIVRALMPVGSIVVANNSSPYPPGETATRSGITQMYAYPSRSSVIYVFKVTG